MSLTVEEIDVLLSETNRLLSGRRVQKIYHIEPHRIYLSFRPRGEKVFLLLTSQPQVSRFHMVWEKPEFPQRPSAFCETLRASLSGKVFEGAVRIGDNRAVRFNFSDCRFSLAGEFFGARGNVILLKGNRVQENLWPVVHGGKKLTPGSVYRLSPPKGSSLSRQSPRYLLRRGEGEFPFTVAFAKVMEQREKELRFAEKKKALLQRLRKEKKRKERLLSRLSEDKREAEAAELYKRKGEVLKCWLHKVKQGDRTVSLPDPFSPEGNPGQRSELEIDLDPRLSPQENLERMFRKYKKAQNAKPVVSARYRECTRELSELKEDLEVLVGLSCRQEDHRGVLSELRKKYEKAPQSSGKGPRRPAPRGPRRFVLKEHLVWVGRNAKENSSLLRGLARGNDFFLHIAGRPGAVIILRPPPGKEVSPEVLGEAGALAVYYSVGGDSGEHDVDYTRVKHVKSLGKETGSFSMADRRTLRVSCDRNRISSILRSQV